MNFKLLTICFFLCAVCYSADISAPKMEIIDTPDGRTTVFSQGITIIDKDNQITGKYAVFYERGNFARITDSVRIINPQMNISADTAIYYFDNKWSNLKGNVQVESDTLKIETSDLIFEQSKNIIKTNTYITIREKKQNLTIVGYVAEYNFTEGTGVIESLPVLYIERKDTTVIRSAKMVLNNRESQFFAIESVTAKTGNTILKCDTLLFFTMEDSGIALGNPRIFDKESWINGTIIKFYFGNSDSAGESDNQNELRTVKIIESANTHYITQDGGILEVSGNLFAINYLNGDIEYIRIFSDSLNIISGTFTPKEEL